MHDEQIKTAGVTDQEGAARSGWEDRDTTTARIRDLAVRSGHTMDRGPIVEGECKACSALTCIMPELLAAFAAGSNDALSAIQLERLAAPLRTVTHAESVASPPDPRDELLMRTLAALELMYLEPDRRDALIESAHDEIVHYLSEGKRAVLATLTPAEVLITSTSIAYAGAHARVRVWNRGACAGELVVNAGDARMVAARLEGHAWREESRRATEKLSEVAESCDRIGSALHDEAAEIDATIEANGGGPNAGSVVKQAAEELEALAAMSARYAREVRA